MSSRGTPFATARARQCRDRYVRTATGSLSAPEPRNASTWCAAQPLAPFAAAPVIPAAHRPVPQCNQFYKTTCDVLVAIHSEAGRPRGRRQAQLPFLAQEDPMQVIKTENTPRPDGEGPAVDPADEGAEQLDMDEGATKQIPAAIDLLHDKGLTTEENDEESVAYLYEFYVRDSPSCRQRTEEQCGDKVCAWTLSGNGTPECVTFLEAPTAIRYVVNRLKGQSVDVAFDNAQSATLRAKKIQRTANKLKSGIFSMFGMQRFAQQEEYYASAAART